MSEQVFSNARIVLPHEVVRGCVQVRDGRIEAIDAGRTAVPAAHDLEGDYLLPGLVEVHTDNLERHVMPRPKVSFPMQGAVQAHDAEIAAAGITTVLDAIGVGDPYGDGFRAHDQGAVLEVLNRLEAAGSLRADHYIHVRCELPAPNARELFEPFMGDRRLRLISLMDHTPGQRQWTDIAHARTYYTGKKGWSAEKFERQVAHAATLQAQYAEPHRRHFVDYCRTHGIALASHDDTTVAHVEQAHAEGASMSEFPTTMAAASAARERGLATVMGGPNVVRGGSHSGNVAAAELARHGLLDILSSDYVPSSLLGAVMRLVADDVFTLPQAVATVTRAPAKATGLRDRGAIEPGLRADLVRVRMTELADGSRHAVVRGVWREGRRVL